jgi:hypothetical protein
MQARTYGFVPNQTARRDFMASHPTNINLHELTSAVTAAVDHAAQQKATLAGLKGPIIMGRVLQQAVEHAAAPTPATDLHAVAQQITNGVNAKVPGLGAKPFVGPQILGFILNVQ